MGPGSVYLESNNDLLASSSGDQPKNNLYFLCVFFRLLIYVNKLQIILRFQVILDNVMPTRHYTFATLLYGTVWYGIVNLVRYGMVQYRV
jgi:ABC-type bacteriocin/lantibiotic exporter with double-glycine peptidase domain